MRFCDRKDFLSSLILSFLIPVRHKVKFASVYMQPLVEELKELWNGVMVYDRLGDVVSSH